LVESPPAPLSLYQKVQSPGTSPGRDAKVRDPKSLKKRNRKPSAAGKGSTPGSKTSGSSPNTRALKRGTGKTKSS
jgi:hypothetical protein